MKVVPRELPAPAPFPVKGAGVLHSLWQEEAMRSEPRELAKAYEPKAVEEKWYPIWKASGIFHAEPDPAKEPYCITIPPPNITGSLHMGHALNNTILDTMTRWHRMRGFCTLCLPGTDHASIATQAVVERELATQGLTRQDLGREKFIERCWEWREQYGTRIYYQFEKLGCSYDWERVRFTMDESYVNAIMEEFRSWYERGLIYRGVRVVNWDVKFQSSVSDIEVNTEARQGKLYHFRYPFADGSGFITIATTRPETMLGDTAVAANPDDERYQPLFGKMLKLPLTDREIPLIADDYARPEFGSGAVKVTPAHDLNDFEAGLRNNLPQVVVIGKDGRMTEAAGPDYAGLARFEARKKVLAEMEARGLLEKTEDYVIQTPISDRSGEVIEPLLSEEWFVDMKPLARPAIDVVQQNKIRFIPERYREIYLHWMENIRDWNISRQLWWGHRIPVWWTDDPNAAGGKPASGGRRHAFAPSQEEAVKALGTEKVWQDEDVLDTWFSSALWPHATLGWPARTADLAYFYPTNLLSTAQEILYLWVARMIMTGLDFIKRPDTEGQAAVVNRAGEEDGLLEPDGKTRAVLPFRDVYIHATVLDEQGRRMSKSLGNGIDPIDLIEKYGADATRFSLMQQAGKNQDIRFSEQRTKEAAQFCNKLWNASRFVLMNLDEPTTGALPPQEALTVTDRWILARLNDTIGIVNGTLQAAGKLSTYDMDDATLALYRFFWSDFCDWYVEMAKPRLRSEGPEKTTVQNVLAYVLETTLRLMHPLLPFITEEIWQALPHQGESISIAPYPDWEGTRVDLAAETAMATTTEAVRAFRNIRAELGITPGARLKAAAVPTDVPARDALDANAALIAELARLETLDARNAAPSAESGKWVGTPIAGAEVFLEIGDALDIGRELARIEKELEETARQIARSEGMLNNPNFVEKANPERVEEERRRLADWQEKRGKLEERRKMLS
jgi:valyl-tRNA synthetase